MSLVYKWGPKSYEQDSFSAKYLVLVNNFTFAFLIEAVVAT